MSAANPTLTPSASLAPFPVTSFASIQTNWANLSAPASVGCVSAAPDFLDNPSDTLWAGLNSGVFTFSLATSTWAQVAPDILIAVSAVSPTEAYGVTGVWGTAGRVTRPDNPLDSGLVHYKNGSATRLPALPKGDRPNDLSAAPDGTLWVLGLNGCYRWTNGNWEPVETGTLLLTSISAGSAGHVWGVAALNLTFVAVRYSDQGGWQLTPDFGSNPIRAIAAAADGSVWAVTNDPKHPFQVKLPGGAAWLPVPMGPAAGNYMGFTAPSQNRCYALLETALLDPFTLGCLSFGIVDQPASGWLPMTPGQQNVYNGISQYLLTMPGSIRAAYNNQVNTLEDYYDRLQALNWTSFSQWYSGLGNNMPPVTQDDWDVMQPQILLELNYASNVNLIFDQIDCLNSSIETLNNTTLSSIYGMVGLTEPTGQDGTDEVIFIIGNILEALVWGLAGALGDPELPALCFALGAGASLVGTGVSALGGLSGPSPGDRTAIMTTTYYDLCENKLVQLYKNAAQTNATSQTLCLANWEMLRVLGQLTVSSIWKWPADDSATIANYAQNTYAIWFYQVLMTAKWQIAYCAWPGQYPGFTPSWNTYVENDLALGTQNVYFCVEIGGQYSLENPTDLGPYPSQSLLNAIWSLGVSQADFYKGQNGWILPQVQACSQWPPAAADRNG